MAFLEQLNGFDTSALDVLQRILLVTDGTLTDTIEAAFSEPISLHKLESETRQACCPITELDLHATETVMTRTVLLLGKYSGAVYVCAKSLLAVDRLPSQLRQDLLATNIPLGRLWSQHRLETWKELLSIDTTSEADIAQYFNLSKDCTLLSRTYRLFSGGRPLMLITEYFPTKYSV